MDGRDVLASVLVLVNGLSLIECATPSVGNKTVVRPHFPILKVTFDHVASVFGICLWILLGILAKIGSFVHCLRLSSVGERRLFSSISSVASIDEEISRELPSDYPWHHRRLAPPPDASRGGEAHLHSQQ